jgi:branched-chain amino acid aminotransferase
VLYRPSVLRSATPTPEGERARILADPGFGRYFTDHVALADWTADAGWSTPRAVPRHAPELPLESSVLHYGQSVFEGLKAFRGPTGEVALFRPDANAARLRRSARRMALPEPPEDLTLAMIEALVGTDAAWVPGNDTGHALYVRPVLFATETGFGVHPSSSARLAVICSPAGSYFAGGFTACSLWVEREHTRAAPGGTGEAKCSGNYAGSMAAQRRAVEHGCDQTLFLDATRRRHLEECGSMNILVGHADGRVITPPLNGCILPGITRDSLLTAAPAWGVDLREEPVDVDDLLAGLRSGAVTEVFACGTGAVLTPVGELRDGDENYRVGDGAPGPVATLLHERLTGLQFGREADDHGWMHPVPARA